MAGDLGGNDAVDLLKGAVMGERRIAAEHAAAVAVHHASADRLVDLESDLVKTFEQPTRLPPHRVVSSVVFAAKEMDLL
jgi:hypothetical protein